MCGRYYTRRQKQEIAERFRVRKVFPEPYPANYNIAPSTAQPVVRLSRDTGEPELVLLRWGLIPFFTKSLADVRGITTINARSETAARSASYREPFRKRRCLVPFDGFYEWAQLSGSLAPVVPAVPQRAGSTSRTPPKPSKQPFAFSLRSDRPAAFAGLWDAWREPKPPNASLHTPDTWIQSFTILTTEANELMAPIHSRMPVILAERDWARWLDREPIDPADLPGLQQLQALLRPFDADLMTAHRANPAVGNVRNNGPEMLTPPPLEITAPPALNPPDPSEEINSQ